MENRKAGFFVNFLRLTRPLSNVKNIAIVFLAFYLSGAPLNLNLLVLGAFALSLIFSGSYAYNAVSDYRVDKKNENKKRYSSAVDYFGKKGGLFISITLSVLGLLAGLAVNIYFFFSLAPIILTGFLYSWHKTRFKERIILDVLFGATFTILLRFVASWLIFKISFPPVLPIFGLVFLKNGGYMLYKGFDRQFLISLNIKNSITALSKNALAIISGLFFSLSIISFALLCLNSTLPSQFLILLVFFIPPIVTQYFLFFNKIKTGLAQMRLLGYALMFLIVIIFALLYL